ncbi:SE1832 family protein [Staphylococcus rostri]|uniref:SE1832 family protein n=1 Tax=Staphylococcus rostri TaxID=522262 RepID=UPI0014767CDB|nr:SE1832 family protein [Staphylococcus rostri]MDO5375346.1 SE1832 family protein [Staphylococcus rostri]
MDLAQQLEELKMDYVRLQGDLEKRESTAQQVDPLIKQLEAIEQQIAEVRAKLRT